MIAGATYRDGIAFAEDGSVYVRLLGASDSVPAGSTTIPGSMFPFGGKKVDSDGAVLVRLA